MRGNITVHSDYMGCRLAGQILQNYQFLVTYGLPVLTDILITDNLKEKDTQKVETKLKIVIGMVDHTPQKILGESGFLGMFGQQKEKPFVPKFLVEIVAANSIVIVALSGMLNLEKYREHRLALPELIQYFGAFLVSAKKHNIFEKGRGENMLDGGAPFYSVYKCKEGYIALGNLEPKFYNEMVKGLGLTKAEEKQMQESQFNFQYWGKMREILKRKMLEKSASQWENHFKTYDTCVTEAKKVEKYVQIQPKITSAKL